MSGTQRGSLDNRVLETQVLTFAVDKKIAQLKKETEWINGESNGLIVLEKTISHDVEALEDTTFILTIIQVK